MLGVYSHIVLFVVGYVASLFFKAPPPPKNLTMYGFKEMIRRRKGRTSDGVGGTGRWEGGFGIRWSAPELVGILAPVRRTDSGSGGRDGVSCLPSRILVADQS